MANSYPLPCYDPQLGGADFVRLPTIDEMLAERQIVPTPTNGLKAD